MKMDSGSAPGCGTEGHLASGFSVDNSHLVQGNVIAGGSSDHVLAETGRLGLSHEQPKVLIAQQCMAFKVGRGNAETQVTGLGGQLCLQPQHLASIQTLRLPERWHLRWNRGCLWMSTPPERRPPHAVSGRGCICGQQVQAAPDHK